MCRKDLVLKLVVVLIIGLLFESRLRSDEPKDTLAPSLPPIANISPTPSKKASPEEIIRQALAKPIDLSFDEVPLNKVVETLRDKLHINIILDKRALAGGSVSDDTPLTIAMYNIPGNDALALILRELNLTLVIQHKVLLITTFEEADSLLETRIYDVADLVHHTESKVKRPDFDSLIEAITTTLHPTSWDSVGGPGSIASFQAVGLEVLIISQTLDVHEELANLLANLRAMRRNGNNRETAVNAPAIVVPQPAGAIIKSSPFTPQEEIMSQVHSQPLTLQFEDTSLKDIVKYIHDKTRIPVVIDKEHLFKNEINVNQPITVNLVGLVLSDALDSMLKENGISWTISKGILVITSPEDVDKLFETKTYDVSDFPAFRNKQGELVPNYNDLIDTITNTIRPTTWDVVGGPGSIVRFEGKGIQAIIVSQQWSVHHKIDKLLSDLRKMRNHSLTKEEFDKLPLPPPPREKPNRTPWFSTTIPSPPPPIPDTKRDAVVQGNNQFAFELYSQLRDKSHENLFVSPYSLSTAFAMSYIGARGKTAAEMANAMRFSLPQEELPLGFLSLNDTLSDENYPGCRLLAANRMWCGKSTTFQEHFLATLRNEFRSELGLVNFQQPEISRNTINDWIKEKTNQKIKELFGPGAINPQTALMMTSAIYFKGYWAHPFDKSATKQKPFYATNKEIMTQMMYRRGSFHYAQYNEIQTVELPYLGNCLSMVILLPKDSEALAELEKSLTAEKLKEWSQLLKIQEGELYLPRFKIDTNYDMIPTLRSMGMKNAFDSKAADFTGIAGKTEPLWLNMVLHKTYIQVDEEGTEAAAATGGGYFGGPILKFVFKADHPFIFLIRDNRTDSILFIGRVMEPQSN
jgi:serpin B